MKSSSLKSIFAYINIALNWISVSFKLKSSSLKHMCRFGEASPVGVMFKVSQLTDRHIPHMMGVVERPHTFLYPAYGIWHVPVSYSWRYPGFLRLFFWMLYLQDTCELGKI
jgi:hypothetical protein